MLQRFKSLFKKSAEPKILYHGSAEPRSHLKLPDHDPKRTYYGNDGAAVYLSSSKQEASGYGKVLHTVEYSGENHLDLDKHMKNLPPQHLIKLTKVFSKQDTYDPTHYAKHKTASDFVNAMGKKYGHVETSRRLVKAGFDAGVGQSFVSKEAKKSGKPDTTVYAVYNPKKTKVVSHEQIK